MSKISPELKDEILNLPKKEKDKLLLRLVAKDQLLIAKLHFQLIEAGLGVEQRRQTIVEGYLEELTTIRSEQALYLLLRYTTGQINTHLKVCADKYGELELSLQVIDKALSKKPQFIKLTSRFGYKLCTYIVKRMVVLLKKVQAIDPEIRFDFSQKINNILTNIHQLPTQAEAHYYSLPKKYNYDE
jgi:hypothetical protein